MKRNHVLILLLISVLIIAGCGEKAYEQAMDKGNTALENMKYSDAVTYFKEALNEKSEDKTAATLLKQTESIIIANDAFEAGDLDDAKENYKDIIETTDGSNILKKHAEEQISDLEQISDKYDEVTKQYKVAKKLGKEEKFSDAFKEIEQALKHNFDHPYISSLKGDLTDLERDLKKSEEKVKKEKAVEEKRIAKEQAQAEKNQQLVEKYTGYWLALESNTSCHLTKSIFACAIPFSDGIFESSVSSITGNANDNSVTVTFTDGMTNTFQFEGDDILHLNDGRYKRVSKEEANAIFEGHYELP